MRDRVYDALGKSEMHKEAFSVLSRRRDGKKKTSVIIELRSARYEMHTRQIRWLSSWGLFGKYTMTNGANLCECKREARGREKEQRAAYSRIRPPPLPRSKGVYLPTICGFTRAYMEEHSAMIRISAARIHPRRTVSTSMFHRCREGGTAAANNPPFL